jgi:amidohydrolase
MDLLEHIKQRAAELFHDLVQIRQHLHKHPELSFQEYKTSEFIQSVLKKHNIPFTADIAETGIVALIQGHSPESKTILLRADMDALPIEEQNDVTYKSVNPGVMHACGHDVHSTCTLGAAIILNELKHRLKGTVKIMFQPGEEVLPGGASLMIKEGVLENPKVSVALAQHVFPSMEAGKVGFKSGMYMASTDELYLTVNGKGGHAAMPAEYVNPLIIASEILLAIHKAFMLPGVLKHTMGENIPTVVAFGKITGNGATNVIPERVDIQGTFRTMNEEWRTEVHKRLQQIVTETSSEYGIHSELRIEKGYPFLINNEELTALCQSWAKEYLGDNMVEELPLRMTAEDFAFITQQVPSCFYRLGTANKEKGITSGVHTPTFDIDEKAIETGSGLMAYLAIKQLS